MSSDGIRDLGEPEHEGTTQRSNRMLLLGVALAILAGGGAAVLKRIAKPATTTSPTSVEIPVTEEATPDGAVLRAALLDQLVEDALTEPDPRRLPAFKAAVLPCRRAGPVCNEAIERLGQSDVPWSLVHAFAAELPPRADVEADALLLPVLAGSDPERAQAALDLLRGRGRVEVGSSMECGCGFGVVPRDATDQAWLVAFAADGETALAWDPREIDGRWVLDVRIAEDGAPVLRHPIEIADGLPTVQSHEGGPVAGRKTTLPPRPPGR